MVKTEGMSDSTENVDDLRGRGARGGSFGGGIPIPGGAATKLGVPGVLLAILGIVLGVVFTGGGGGGFGNITTSLDGQEQPAGSGGVNAGATLAPGDPALFTVKIFNDVQSFWADYFASGSGVQWRDARLSPFTGAVQTACGGASSASGPFYCPGDEHVYIDLDFFDEMVTRFNAPGDFAQAYVIAHEVGHHVQNVTGIEAQVRQEQQRTGKVNELSVRLELQADCFAGVWAHGIYSRQLLESGDLEEALGAASAVGDDRLQKQATGRINPDTFTHGTSEQRSNWFRAGFESGDASRCDTFSGDI